MTFATKASLHVRTQRRRTPRRSNPGIVKGLIRSLAGILILGTTGIAVMAGAGWIFSTTLKARSETRTSVAFAHPSVPSTRLGVLDGIPSLMRSTVASMPPPLSGTTPPGNSAGLTVVAKNVLSGGESEDSVDPSYTGSLAPLSPKSVKPIIFSAGLPAITPPIQEETLPLPRARPRVASLQPPDDIGVDPEDFGSLKTAVYDITAQTVYLPNGERLEAHSGFGSMMDDPRHVRTRMRGATPPNTYRLSMREALFHGVKAIRLTPVDDAKMFGRDGMLAHSYLLGPNGQSNGCVSFKNYPRFLQAFERGEVNRLVVVARLDKPPASLARRGFIRSAAATP